MIVTVLSRKSKKHMSGDKYIRSGRNFVLSQTTIFFFQLNNANSRSLSITTLTTRQYCIIHDTVDADFKNQLGKKLVRRGECSFFLHPGESIPEGNSILSN